MTRKSSLAIPFALALVMIVGPGAQAQDEWKFGIGTGITSFSLDGDVGFPGVGGGTIFDVDLDNSDTSDLIESGFGLGGYAAKGKWQILYQAGTVKLEDSDGSLSAEWDRTQVEVAGVYNFAKTGNNRWGALFGLRYIKHEWDFSAPLFSAELDEDWTDALIGLTHALSFAGGKWSWTNRLDGGFGDSEGSFLFQTAINRLFGQHWLVYLTARQHSIDFGDEDDIDELDFYLYDVDEPGFGIGVLYVW